MQCPNCNAECLAEDVFCRRCGTDLTPSSTSLVPAQANLPAILHNPQLPRLAAGVGALAVGFGLELLRRSLLARVTRPLRSDPKYLPAQTFSGLRDIFSAQSDKPIKLPKGYEIHETAIYMRRVIRRED
jgi:hypothetical protein